MKSHPHGSPINHHRRLRRLLKLLVWISLPLPLGAGAAVITSTWTGGAGDWSDPRWSFAPPGAATFPDNLDGDFFSVRLDGGAAGNSRVTLSRVIELDRLAISTGDILDLQGGTLRFAQDAARPGSGNLLISRGGTIVGAGFLGGAGPGSGTMTLTSRGGRIIANGGTLTINPSGNAGTTLPPLPLQNLGAMGALGLGSTLLIKNSFVEQAATGSAGRGGNIRTATGGNVILEDSLVHGGTVRVAPCLTPLVCGELDLNRGSIVQGTNVTIGENGVVRVLASAFPGGTLPARMNIQGGSVLIEAGVLNPVALTLDAGAGAADTLNFSNAGNPANPGRIITNWPSGLPVEGSSVIRIAEGNVTLANPAWRGGNTPRGGIFLNGVAPGAAVITADTAGRTLTVGSGSVITTMPGRSGSILEPAPAPLQPNGPRIVVDAGGQVAANIGSRLEIGALTNQGGLVQALRGGTLALGREAITTDGEVQILAGGRLETKGDYRQAGGKTLVEGNAAVGGAYTQDGGTTVVRDGGTTVVRDGGLLQAGIFVIKGGTVAGNAYLQGLVTSEGAGTVEPGEDRPGVLHIIGDYVQDGILSINIDGYDIRLGEYSQLDVHGAAILGGSVKVALNGGFDPLIGSYFDILRADDIFDIGVVFDFPLTPTGNTFVASFLDLDSNGRTDTLRITVTVPEPATLQLALLGLLGVVQFLRHARSAAGKPR